MPEKKRREQKRKAEWVASGALESSWGVTSQPTGAQAPNSLVGHRRLASGFHISWKEKTQDHDCWNT